MIHTARHAPGGTSGHEPTSAGGSSRLVIAAVVLVAGLLGRWSKPEPPTELGARAALVVAVAGAAFAGMRAGRGTTEAAERDRTQED